MASCVQVDYKQIICGLFCAQINQTKKSFFLSPSAGLLGALEDGKFMALLSENYTLIMFIALL